MIYAIIPARDGVPLTNHKVISAVSINETKVMAQIETDELENGWVVVTEEEWKEKNPDVPEPPIQPSELDILGQQLVDKELQILALQEENQLLGQQLVARELEAMDFRSENEMQGQALVDLELRLLALEGGSV